MQNQANLNFIRSIAVLLVAISHFNLYTDGGFVPNWTGITGVCIFFVHTSLVLMWSLERDSQIGRFYIRRIFRIYPLWLVVLFLTLATRLPMAPLFAPRFVFYFPPAGQVISNALLIMNLDHGANIVGASWSLPIEVQMYLFLPFLFVFARSFRVIWPLLAIDGFLAFYAYRTLPAENSSLLMCTPYFLPGVMAFLLYKRTTLKLLPGWAFPVYFLAWAWASCVFGSWRRSWIFCLVLGLTLPLFKDMTYHPVRIASHYLAKYSYGVYLSHIAAIGVSVHVLRSHPLSIRVGAFLILFCLAPIVFYHGIEEPMIRVGARLAKRVGKGSAVTINERALDLEPAP